MEIKRYLLKKVRLMRELPTEPSSRTQREKDVQGRRDSG